MIWRLSGDWCQPREPGFSENGEVFTNPIAGTRPRGANEAEDAALADELSHDVKETAEHRMLVDLGRNDIGKIAKMVRSR